MEKKIINIRVGISETEKRKTIKKFNKIKTGSLKRLINKTDNPLARLSKIKSDKEKIQITNPNWKKDITIKLIEIRNIREYYEQLFAIKLDNIRNWQISYKDIN